jgi:hypothetical protein
MTNSSKTATQKKWTTAKRFKVAGSALLLVAFAMQAYQTKVSARENVKMQANELDGRQHMKALGYENLYFAEKAATAKEDNFSLYGAAMEMAVGRNAMVTVSDEPHDVKQERIDKLTEAVQNVKDLESFNAFTQILKSEQGGAHPSELNAYIAAGKLADRLWWIYICVYFVGSVCLLRSQYLE